MHLWRKKFSTLATIGLIFISMTGLAHVANLTKNDNGAKLCQSSCGTSLPTTGIVFDNDFEQDNEPDPFATTPYYALFLPLLATLALLAIAPRIILIRPPDRLAQSALLRI